MGKPVRQHLVTVRLSRSEQALLRRHRGLPHESVGQTLRRLALEEAHRMEPRRCASCHRVMADDERSFYEDEEICAQCAPSPAEG